MKTKPVLELADVQRIAAAAEAHAKSHQWAVCIALCLRGLPLLIEEIRLLVAVHRLRPTSGRSDHPSAEMGIMDMVTAAMSSALRRSSEMSEAITARGASRKAELNLTVTDSEDGADLAVEGGLIKGKGAVPWGERVQLN